jgi:UDP-N-acetylglucosamine 4,6-dehydratase/5-epimerase
MKKILVTGGVGTVGQAFISKYYNDYHFINFSRNEMHISELSAKFPKVKSVIGDIQDGDRLINIFLKERPDIVIHAAALKHVNLAEQNPSKAIEINILGSLNLIKASIRAEVPIIVGVSTDKACQPENIYGYSKRIMEQMFIEHYNPQTKFVCTRFANIAASNGSVIQFWLKLAQEGKPLKLTDSRMNRLMFSSEESALLIHKAIEYAEVSTAPFILSRIMKSVNMLELAKSISKEYNLEKDIEIIGLRPGEKLNETLISQRELEDAYITEDKKYVALYNDSFGNGRVTRELSSLTAEYMNEKEIKDLYKVR